MNAYEKFKIVIIAWVILVATIPLLAFREFKIAMNEIEKEQTDIWVYRSHIVSAVICVIGEMILLGGIGA